jgi:transcriptional regulator with XRE-family HTH domain
LPPRRQPSSLARQLAKELRRRREAALMTGEEAAAQLGWSASKVSRIETGQAVGAEDLGRLLDLYQVTGFDRDALSHLARSVEEHRRGWWDAYTDTLGHGYAEMIKLEAGAKTERQYVPTLVPGLLQTPAYATEIIRTSLLDAPEEAIRQRVLVRTRRQHELSKDDPLELAVVIDEAVLRRQVGGPALMKEQLSHLVEMAALPNITLQVLLFTNGPHPGITTAFFILQSPGVIATEVVYQEYLTGELFIWDPNEIVHYSRTFDRLREISLEPDESVALIARTASRIK